MEAGKKRTGGAILATVAFVVLAFAPAAGANTASTGAVVFPFPSSSSSVVGSVGFIDDCQAGYFWSASRGDGVSQSHSGPRAIRHVILDVAVPTNVLNGGNHVDWNLIINGKIVDSFSVTEGFTGTIHRDVKFAKIRGRNFDIHLAVTNEVPSGGGSITLSYADCGGAHSIKLKKY
jgi:hypothetical protein